MKFALAGLALLLALAAACGDDDDDSEEEYEFSELNVESIDVEQPRCDARETAITGPMFGPKMRRPLGDPGEWENQLLESHALRIEDFARFAKLAEGTRRPYLIRPQELSVNQESHGLKFQFVLPSGVYATTLLREFQKSDATS